MFWKGFYESAEVYLLPSYKKRYFVFTDAKNIYAQENSNVCKVYQDNLGWPYNTLLRFEMFLKIEPELKKCEFLFFLNANIVFINEVGDEILPNDEHENLLAVLHPGFWNKKNDEFTYDKNPMSSAYIEKGIGNHYFMGGFNGGTSKGYLQLANTLKKNIRADLNNGIIALWHDESHLNHYLLNKNPKVLSPEYGYPEGLDLPFKPKLLILDKNKYGGHTALRAKTGYGKTWLSALKQLLKSK